jgi:hypothetical protein
VAALLSTGLDWVEDLDAEELLAWHAEAVEIGKMLHGTK